MRFLHISTEKKYRPLRDFKSWSIFKYVLVLYRENSYKGRYMLEMLQLIELQIMYWHIISKC